MQDLFGQEVQMYRGQVVDQVNFSDQESEKVMEEVIFDGLLLKQMSEALNKLRLLKDRPGITLARREAWEELMWVFDLWHAPAYVTFDLACELAGVDAEHVRGRISHEFADEIRLMFETVVSRHPDERAHLLKRLHYYIDLREEMH